MVWYRRTVEPLGRVIDFQLEDIVDVGERSYEQPKLSEVEPWIDYGGVSLRVIALESYLTEEDRTLLRDDRFCSVGGGQERHRTLIALAWLYLKRTGHANACRLGASACGYSGGWADGCVPGANYFVECGTMRYDKPHRAMAAGETLLIIPYGCHFLKTRTDPGPRLGFELKPIRPLKSYDDEAFLKYVTEVRRSINILDPKHGKE